MDITPRTVAMTALALATAKTIDPPRAPESAPHVTMPTVEPTARTAERSPCDVAACSDLAAIDRALADLDLFLDDRPAL